MSGTSFPVTIRLRADGKGLEGTLRVTEREARRLQRGLDNTGRTAQRTGRQMQGAGAQVDRFGARAQSAGLRLGSFVRTLFLLAGIGGVVAGIGTASRALADFESQMAGVRAVTQPTEQEFRQLTSTARELGATTEFSAGQAAAGMRFLGQAGFSAAQQIAAIPATLDLATAAQLDLSQAADITSNVLSGFRMRAEQAGRMADVLAATSASANTNVSQLGDAMAFVGPVANALGIEVEGAAAAVGVLSDAGIQGSAAGTGLRRVLSSLANPTREAVQTLQAMGLTLDDVNPATNELTDIIDRLGARGLTAADALQIFGDRGGPAILALVGQNDRLRELTAEIQGAEGAAGDMADTMRDTLRGDVQALGSAVQELMLTLGETGLLDVLRAVVQMMTGEVRGAIGGMQNNMLELQLAGIAMVVALRVAFAELRGVFELQRDITTEIFAVIGNTWNATVAGVLEGTRRLVQGVAAAADFVPGLSGMAQGAAEVATSLDQSAAAARGKIVSLNPLNEILNNYRAGVNDATSAARAWGDEMADNAIAADLSRGATDELTESTGELAASAGDAADEIVRQGEAMEGVEDAATSLLRQLRNQVGQMRQQRVAAQGGARAVREWQIQQLALAGASDEVVEQLRAQHEVITEMEDQERIFQAAADQMAEMANIAVRLATGMDMVANSSERAGESMRRSFGGDLARSMSHALSAADGRSIGDSIGQALRAQGAQGIQRGLEDAFHSALESMELDLDDPKVQAGLNVGMASLGAAMAGNMGEALGTAVGGALGSLAGPGGTMIGSAVGGIIGGMADSTRDPRFAFAGSGTRAGDAAWQTGNISNIDTELGEVGAYFSRMDAAARREITQAFRSFDRTLAGLLSDDMLPAAQAALENFEYDSRLHGDSVEAMMAARFDAVLTVFDDFTAGIIRQGVDLEEQMQRLADTRAIERQLALGRGLGLTGAGVDFVPDTQMTLRPTEADGLGDLMRSIGDRVRADMEAFNRALEGTGEAAAVTNPALAHTLQVVDDLNRPGETLAETFERLREIAGSLDTALALTGNRIGQTREDLIRFGDSLEAAFGDGLGDAMSTIFGRFFSGDERMNVIADQASERARDLLEQLGLDVTDAMLTESGFRQVFDELFGSLSPEDTAVLIEAGVAIDQLIAAEEGLLQTRRSQVDELRNLAQSIGDEIREMQWSPLRQELHDLSQQHLNNMDTLRRLNASEAVLDMERERFTLRQTQLVGMLRASLADLASEFNGATQAVQRSSANMSSAVGGAVDNMRDTIIRGLQGVQDWLQNSQLDNLSSLRPDERLDVARDQFRDAISAVQSGDMSQLADLPGLADAWRREAAGFHGTSTEQFRGIEEEVRAAMQAVADIEPPAEQQQPTFAQTADIVSATRGTERSAMDQAATARRIVDELGVLSGLSESTAAELAREYDLNIAELIHAVTGELPALTGDALGEYFNDLVAETDQQLSAIGRVEEIGGEQLDVMNRIDEIGAEQLSVMNRIDEIGGEQLSAMNLAADLLRDIRDANGAVEGLVPFATGGVVTRPTRGVVGEAGPEAIIPLDRFFNQVLPAGGGNDAETKRLLAQIEQRLARIEAHSGDGNSQRAELIGVTGQGLATVAERERETAKRIQQLVNKPARRRGESLDR